MVAFLFERLEHRSGRFAVRSQRRTRIVLEEFHGFLHQKLVVLADHTLTVLAARAATRTFVLEQHLIGRVVLAGKALRLIEVVAFQFGHVTLVEPPGDIFDPHRLPRTVTPFSKMFVVDLLLYVGGIFGDLRSDAHRNILLVEHPGQGVDQLAELQARTDVGLRLAELAHEALDRMPSRLQGPLIGSGFFARPYVLALQVFRDGGILRLGVRQIPHQSRDEFQTRHCSRPIAALAVDDLEALIPRTHADRLKNARLFDALGKFQQRFFAEVLPGIVGRIDDFVQIKQPDIRLRMNCRLVYEWTFLISRFLRFDRRFFGNLDTSSIPCFLSGDVGNSRLAVCILAPLLRLCVHFRSLHNIEQFLPCVSRVFRSHEFYCFYRASNE